MTEIEQRIAIAEACGFSPDGDGLTWRNGPHTKFSVDELPDYLHDLNDCYEMELDFDDKPPDLRSLWLDNLAFCCSWPHTKNAADLKFEVSYAIARATAPQRCEAFLRTLGKWRD